MLTTSIIAMLSSTILSPTNLPTLHIEAQNIAFSKQELVSIIEKNAKEIAQIETTQIELPKFTLETKTDIASSKKIRRNTASLIERDIKQASSDE